MYIKRKLTSKLKQSAKEFPVVAVIGPRQSGKTTLVKNTFPGYKYISLENPDTREFAKNDPKNFLNNYNNGVIIDEAQRVPDLFSYIQGIVDEDKKPGQFILTGSQNFLLHNKINQSLAGRVSILKLLPLSLEELSSIDNDYEYYLYNGFYPKLYDSKISPNDWHNSYIQTYIERDIRQLKNITDLNTFQKFIKMCANRTGQILNLSSLANDCGISHNTAKSWISILEASFIIFLLEPHYKNFNKRLIKSPKLYFYDVGLVSNLLNIENKDQIIHFRLKGELFETFVIAELMKNRFNEGQKNNNYFWRDKTGNEIDCLIETANNITPIEIKSGKTITSDYFKNINYWNKLSKNRPGQSYVVYGGNENQKRKQGNIISWNSLESIN
ncbi:MAG: ATP-binding protein [Patescibacteria group bacterium]